MDATTAIVLEVPGEIYICRASHTGCTTGVVIHFGELLVVRGAYVLKSSFWKEKRIAAWFRCHGITFCALEKITQVTWFMNEAPSRKLIAKLWTIPNYALVTRSPISRCSSVVP